MIQTIWPKKKEISQIQFSQQSDRIQCCYINHTAQFQIIRISSTESTFFEKTALPHAKIIFEAGPDDYLEIHTGNPICSILSDKISCHRLALKEEHSP